MISSATFRSRHRSGSSWPWPRARRRPWDRGVWRGPGPCWRGLLAPSAPVPAVAPMAHPQTVEGRKGTRRATPPRQRRGQHHRCVSRTTSPWFTPSPRTPTVLRPARLTGVPGSWRRLDRCGTSPLAQCPQAATGVGAWRLPGVDQRPQQPSGRDRSPARLPVDAVERRSRAEPQQRWNAVG